MAWDTQTRGPLSSKANVEEYSGDAPWDALGGALSRIVKATADEAAPTAAQLAIGLTRALGSRRGRLLDPEAIEERMAPLLAALGTTVPAPKRPKAKAGDVLTIEYTANPTRSVYAHVLFAPSKELTGPSVGLGVCIIVFDRDVGTAKDDDLAEIVRTAPVLLRPLHPTDELIKDGTWKIVGNVPADPSRLPTFEVIDMMQGGGTRVLRDYFDQEIPNTPENRARSRPMSVGGGGSVRVAIRGLRGVARWLPTMDDMR